MIKLGLLVISAVVLTGNGGTASDGPPKSPPPVKPSKELLDALLKAYTTYELPLPPADALLVRFPIGVRTIQKDGSEHEIHTLGFVLKRANEGEPAKVFWQAGYVRELGRREKAQTVDPKPTSLAEIDRTSIELAVQCHSRGWSELALKVLEWELEDIGGNPETRLAQSAWSFWETRILTPGTDRAQVAKQLHLIRKLRPDDFGEIESRLLRSLELALAPARGKPGTVESLIDGLIDVTRTNQSDTFMIGEVHPNYLALARRGFEAVPALIEHLNDERLTRARKEGFNNFRGYHYRVGDVVCDLLQGLSGEELGKNWLRRQQGYRLDKAAVTKWWLEAKEIGEESYFVRRVLENKNDKAWPNWLILQVLAHKYPSNLPGVYRRLVDDRPDMHGSDVAEAVATSSLSKESKRDLFRHGISSKSLDHRQDAIEQLHGLEPKDAASALVTALNAVTGESPHEKKDDYRAVHRFAHLVIQVNDPGAWTALEKLAERSSSWTRAEILRSMFRAPKAETARRERLQFLAKFLNDEVWKSATGTAAAILNLDAQPNLDWSEKDWIALREEVRGALGRR
jgi:hypothetical protein